MQYEMAHHHYFLQYHIYALALHRFLQMRLGDRYSYDENFGGVMYLFFRGMTGADATDPTLSGGRPGVFTDRPPVQVLTALDQLFAGQGVSHDPQLHPLSDSDRKWLDPNTNRRGANGLLRSSRRATLSP